MTQQNPASPDGEMVTQALQEFVAWWRKQDDGEDGVNYLNGDSDKYQGDGQRDLDNIASRAIAALASAPRPDADDPRRRHPNPRRRGVRRAAEHVQTNAPILTRSALQYAGT